MGETSPVDLRFKLIFQQLFDCFGPQHWWPGECPFEVMVGAILTQSAAWSNVEKAIANLRQAGALSPQALRRLPQPEIARLIYPCGYYNAKAKKLASLAGWLKSSAADDIDSLAMWPASKLRPELLAVHGIGRETADSILLYALGKPLFVIDTYTRRTFARLGIRPDTDNYDRWQRMFMDNLPTDTMLFNEYHALLVRLGKEHCRKVKITCQSCCLVFSCAQAKLSCRI